MLRNKTCGKQTRFTVICGKMHSAPLISRETLTDRGMMKIDPDGNLAEPNEMGTQDEKNAKSVLKDKQNKEMKQIIEEFYILYSKVL